MEQRLTDHATNEEDVLSPHVSQERESALNKHFHHYVIAFLVRFVRFAYLSISVHRPFRRILVAGNLNLNLKRPITLALAPAIIRREIYLRLTG